MRPNGRAELDSLYFNYPHFDAPSRATAQAQARLSAPASVTIVGAGPVGMVAALTLAQRGVPCVLIDNKSSFNDGSRAICVSRSSMHIFHSLGLVQPFLDKALPWVSGRSFFRGQEILEFFMPDSPHYQYRPMYNLQQQYIEAYLYQAVVAQPLIDIRWQTAFVDVQDKRENESQSQSCNDNDNVSQHGVTLTVQDPQGRYELRTQYLIAADGARSGVRSAMGLRLAGNNFEGRYVIADIRMPLPRKIERLALFDPDCRRGGTVLVHQQPEQIWRIDYQLRAGENEFDAMQEANIRTSVAAVVKEIGYEGDDWELEWWSVYSANTLALENYRHGKAGQVFFIGDSAHIVPIFGVRGLNNGLADAHNLGWKLAQVLNGNLPKTAQERLLNTYTPERRGATLDVFANASKSASFMTPQTRGWALLRDAALSLALSQPFAGLFANPRQMTPYQYDDSDLTQADGAGLDADFMGGPTPGEAAPDARLESGFLLDCLGTGFTLLVFGAPSTALVLPDSVQATFQIRIVHLPADSAVAAQYAAPSGSAYLIRPDWHIAARWKSVRANDVESYFHTVFA